MSNIRPNTALLLGLSGLLWACTDMVTIRGQKITPGRLDQVLCPGPPILQNVVGWWRCGQRQTQLGDTLTRSAPFTKETFSRFGTLTFGPSNVATDPDFLFDQEVEGWGRVLYHKFDLLTDPLNYPSYGEMLWIWQYATDRQGVTRRARGYYFKVIANECDRIHLRGDAYEMVLIRQ